MTLTFDAARHAYALDGVEIPGVSAVLQAAGLTQSMQWVPASALERGRVLHDYIAADLSDDLIEDAVDPIAAPYLAAHRQFRADLGERLVPVEHETPHAHATLRYAGTPDWVVDLDGARTVIDVKTGKPEPVHAIQGAAYCRLVDAPGRLGLYLTAEGRYSIVRWTDRGDWPLFASALSLWHWRATHGLLAEELTR